MSDVTIRITGRTGSGKTVIAEAIRGILEAAGIRVSYEDPDATGHRPGLSLECLRGRSVAIEEALTNRDGVVVRCIGPEVPPPETTR